MSTANDLINDLKQETENSRLHINTDSPPAEQTPDSGGAQSSDQHFDPVSPEEQSKLTGQPDPEYSPVAAKSAADRYVKMFSSFLKLILTPLYRKTILHKEDPKKMDEFRRKHAGQSEKQMDEAVHSDHEMWPVVNRFDQYMKAVAEIPLDEDERDMIATPLSDVLYRYRSFRLSPGWMLIVAVCIVMLPRLVSLIPDVNKAAEKK
jgi:hypothetical protein